MEKETASVLLEITAIEQQTSQKKRNDKEYPKQVLRPIRRSPDNYAWVYEQTDFFTVT